MEILETEKQKFTKNNSNKILTRIKVVFECTKLENQYMK